MRATSSVPSLGTMYFLAMESAWPLTAVAEALQGDFAEQAAGFRAAQDVFKRLRGQGEAAALFVNGANLLLKLQDLFASVFQFGGDGGLAVGGDLRGVGDAILQRFGDALEALGDGLTDGLDLP